MNKLMLSTSLLGAICLTSACQHHPSWEAGLQRAEALAEVEANPAVGVFEDAVDPLPEPQPLTRVWVFQVSGVGAVGDSELDHHLAVLLTDLGQWQYIEHIEVIGHTDDQGTEEYNQRLSVARADRVAERLIIAGIDEQIIAHKGQGELQPVADNATGPGRADNRRVEIRVTGLGPWPEDSELALLPEN